MFKWKLNSCWSTFAFWTLGDENFTSLASLLKMREQFISPFNHYLFDIFVIKSPTTKYCYCGWKSRTDFSESFSLTELYCSSVRTYLQHRNKVKQNSVITTKKKRKNIQLRFLSFVVDPIECMRSRLSFFLVDDVLVRRLENC